MTYRWFTCLWCLHSERVRVPDWQHEYPCRECNVASRP